MTALARRLRKLESRRHDASGLIPHSAEWFAFHEDRLARWVVEEDLPVVPLAMIDRIMETADREARAEV